MSAGNIFIAAFWLFLIVDAYLQGLAVPHLFDGIVLPDFPQPLAVVFLLTVFAICFLVTFRQRRHLVEDMPLITAAMDRRFGEGTYRSFNKRLRPVGISMLSSFILAATALRATFDSTRNPEGYLVSFLFLSIALGLFSAWLLSRRHPPRLR